MEQAVVIEPAPEDQPWEGLPDGLGWDLDPESLDPAFIRDRVRQAGLVGMGGRLPGGRQADPKPGTEPDVVILNGAECEPAITSDHRLMLEHPEQVVLGLRLFMRASGAKRGIIAVEANKPDAAGKLSQLVAGDPAISVEVLPVRYPQGAEKIWSGPCCAGRCRWAASRWTWAPWCRTWPPPRPRRSPWPRAGRSPTASSPSPAG